MSFASQDIQVIFNDGNFPEFVRRLKRLGILAYEYNNEIGEFTFFGADGHQEVMPSNGLTLNPVDKVNPEAVQTAVKKFQSGATEFSQFAKEAAELGIYTWQVNLEKLDVEFFNHKGDLVYREVFASVFD